MDRKNVLTTIKTFMSHHTSILLGDFSFFHLDILFLFVESLIKFDTLDGGCSFPHVYWATAQIFQKMSHSRSQ